VTSAGNSYYKSLRCYFEIDKVKLKELVTEGEKVGKERTAA
jgi:hypothetical protein